MKMASSHCRVGPVPILLLAFSLFFITPVRTEDLYSDSAALLAFIAPFGSSSVRWDPNNSPCSWRGITCQSNRVTELRLPGVGLLGDVPEYTLGNLTALRVISLRSNSLTGPVPAELGDIATLININLQGNNFSGKVPMTILSLYGLKQLSLAGNQLTGPISPGFANLTNLQTLFLDGNLFVGPLPDLNMTSLTGFNVSYNGLSGRIPPSLSRFNATSFLGMPLCGLPLPPCKAPVPVKPPVLPPVVTPPSASPPKASPPSANSNSPHAVKKHRLSGGAIAGIASAAAVAMLVVASVFILFSRKPQQSYKRPYQVDSPSAAVALRAKEAMGSPVPTPRQAPMAARSVHVEVVEEVSPPRAAQVVPPREENSGGAPRKRLVFFGRSKKTYDLDDLLRASAEVLGKGSFGTTYKAMLEMGQVVAVKRLKEVSTPEREFRDKITAFGAMDHPNLVPIRAYYYNKDEKLLVYDYMPMGSLSSLLHGNRGSGRPPLNWGTRSSIALAAAHGLNYIHSASPQCAHGNIKSSNILLSGTNNSSPEWARIADHGLAHLVGGSAAVPTRGGTCYKAPELIDLSRASQKSDVYSFGVLLLELLTGRAPLNAEGGVDLPRWVQQEFSDQLLDVELMRENQRAVHEMMRMMQLAMECVILDPESRPTMGEVVRQIEDIRDLTDASEVRSDSMASSIDDTGERPLRRSGTRSFG